MGYSILLVAATAAEAGVIKKIKGIDENGAHFRFRDTSIDVLISGPGCISTAWALKDWLDKNQKPDLVLNIGIAGSYNACYKVGDIVMPVVDCFADFGIEDREKQFFSVFESGLIGKDTFPFINGSLKANVKPYLNLDKVITFVNAVTVNMVSGSEDTIEKIKNKYNPDIETMEGATFFYICTMEKVPFLAIRAISNKVEPRDKNGWNISLALSNLASKLEEVLLVLK